MAVTTVSESGAALAEQVIIKGDLARLTEAQRMTYYTEVCRSLGLNPLTRPFEYITLNGKLTLYATRAASDQLRRVRGITITNVDPRQVGDLYVVVATGRDRSGREDSSTGAVSTKGLGGEALANALMKAETKAKRRLTLSLAGLGWSDETEVAEIGTPPPSEPRLSLAEKAAEKRASLAHVYRDQQIRDQEAAAEPVMSAPMSEEESDAMPYDEEAETPQEPGLSSALFLEQARNANLGKVAIAGALDVTPDKVTERIRAMDDAGRYRLAQSLGIVP
jgi:hypothetical protein